MIITMILTTFNFFIYQSLMSTDQKKKCKS